MNRLLKAKEWVTIPQAAKHLSDFLKEEVTEVDVFQFALSGKITLSVVLSGEDSGARCKILPLAIDYVHLEEHHQFGLIERKIIRNKHLVESHLETIVNLEGFFDLSMYGGEYTSIMNYYHFLTEDKDKFYKSDFPISGDSPAVLEKDGKLYSLYSKYTPSEPWLETQYLSHSLPTDANIIIRTSVLKAFEKKLSDNNEREKTDDDAKKRSDQMDTKIGVIINDLEKRGLQINITSVWEELVELSKNQQTTFLADHRFNEDGKEIIIWFGLQGNKRELTKKALGTRLSRRKNHAKAR